MESEEIEKTRSLLVEKVKEITELLKSVRLGKE
jgi:hypothetical protein